MLRFTPIWLRRAALAPLALVPFCVATQAHAQNDPAAAEALFEQARKLMTDGRYADACPKLEESDRLDPGIGTKFQLANCWQHQGRTASAWAKYREVAAAAKTAGQGARERAARDRAAALEPQLSRIVVTVQAGDTPNVKVLRDGVELGRGQWGAALPVDPGEHAVVVSAPGKRTWQKTVTVPATGSAMLTVQVPPLEDAPGAVAVMQPQTPAIPPPTTVAPPPAQESTTIATTAAPPAAERASSSGSTQRTIGVIVAGIGVAGLITGSVFGLQSKSRHDDSNAHCVGNVCDPTGVSLRDDAIRDGNISTVAFGVGGAALIGGIILWATAPHDAPASTTTTTTTTTSRIQAAPMFGRGASGISLSGAF